MTADNIAAYSTWHACAVLGYCGKLFFFSSSSFYSNVNLETVARGLFRLRMIYQSSGGAEIFYLQGKGGGKLFLEHVIVPKRGVQGNLTV